MARMKNLIVAHEEHQLLSRRTVVTTGAKLAYAAPVIAASMGLSRRAALALDYCEQCIADELSPKPLEDGCYTCKAPEAGCVSTRSNTQAAPADGQGGVVCVCQGNATSQGKSKCVINGTEYSPGQIINDGICHPVNVFGNPAYDTCISGVSPI
jgi:hypothetical protein